MTAFAILVKSYLPDLPYAERLIDSFTRHNPEEIPLYLVVPDEDRDAFRHLEGPSVTVMGEGRFAHHLVTEPLNGYSPGYINQEIVKLAFWETGLADNYLCLDSDAEVLRDLSIHDFMADPVTPFTFLTEDAELRVEPEYYNNNWSDREERLRRIQSAVGLDDQRLLTVHGHAVFSATVLRSFAENFLAPRGWDYRDALDLSPYEPTWYNMWLQKDRTIPIIMREPVVKTVHNRSQILDYALRGITPADIARGYVAVIVNSNFTRGDRPLSASEPPAQVLASFVDAPDLLRAMMIRLRTYLFVDKVPYRRTRTYLGAIAARIPLVRRYVDLG